MFDINAQAPEIYVECEACNGEGSIEKWEGVTPWAIDPPCAIVIPCNECCGVGGFICEATGE